MGKGTSLGLEGRKERELHILVETLIPPREEEYLWNVHCHQYPLFLSSFIDGGAEKVSTTKNYSTDAIASEPSPFKNGILSNGNNVAALVCCCPLFN